MLAESDTTIIGKDLVALQDKAQGRAKIANYAFGTGGAFLLGAAVMFLFTDWHGYGKGLQGQP